MIEWGALSKSLGYDSTDGMWKDLYLEKKLSIGQLSRKLDVSRNVVRLELSKAGIKARGRGGPNNSHVVLTEELLDEIRRDGLTATAKRLGLTYPALYMRLRKRGMSLTELRQAASIIEVDREPSTGDVNQTLVPEGSDDVDVGNSK